MGSGLHREYGHKSLRSSTKHKAKPAKTKAKPAKTRAKPIETRAKPAETKAKPAETKAKPAETRTKPAKTRAKLAKTRAKPAKTKAKATNATAEVFTTSPENANTSKDVIMIDSSDELSESSEATVEYMEDNDDPMYAYMYGEEDVCETESTITTNLSPLPSPSSLCRPSIQPIEVADTESTMSANCSSVSSSPCKRTFQPMISLLSGKQVNIVTPETSPVKQAIRQSPRTNRSFPQGSGSSPVSLLKSNSPRSILCQVLPSSSLSTSNVRRRAIPQPFKTNNQGGMNHPSSATSNAQRSICYTPSPSPDEGSMHCNKSSTSDAQRSRNHAGSCVSDTQPSLYEIPSSSKASHSSGRSSPYRPPPQPLFVIEPDSDVMMDLPVEGATAEQSFPNKSSPNPRNLLKSLLCRSSPVMSLGGSANNSDVDPASDNEYGLRIAQVRTLSGHDAKDVFWPDNDV